MYSSQDCGFAASLLTVRVFATPEDLTDAAMQTAIRLLRHDDVFAMEPTPLPPLPAAAVDPSEVTPMANQSSSGTAKHLVLSGGSTPQALYKQFKEHLIFESISTEAPLHLWIGDERMVEESDASHSNAYMVRAAWLNAVEAKGWSVPFHTVRPRPMSESAADAARRYASEMEAEPSLAKDEYGVPVFTVLLLGVGPDGHIASLFPPAWVPPNWGAVGVEEEPPPSRCCRASLESSAEETPTAALSREGGSRHIVVNVTPLPSVSPALERVTITPAVIRAAKHIIVMATGAAKRWIFADLLHQARPRGGQHATSSHAPQDDIAPAISAPPPTTSPTVARWIKSCRGTVTILLDVTAAPSAI